MSKLKDLTSLVAKYEKELNSFIQERLNDSELINNTNDGLQKHLNSLRRFRKFTEVIAHQLNLPTKDDVAAVSRLVMQLEEKLDQIEDMLRELLEENSSEAASQVSLGQNRTNQDSESQQEVNLENADQEFEGAADEESPQTLKTKIVNFLSELGKKVLKDAVKNALAQRGNTGA